ncbi:hypothetical protein JW851_02615 [Candidatus Woesearchaeota archaeon]|nr:hypothetical protein [Candidatus Woesearchaeota archaeon]
MTVIRNRYTDYDSEYVTIADYIVNFKDVFIMKSVYRLMREWFIEEGYATTSDKDFPEIFYLEKEEKAGKEMWIRWRFSKSPLGGKMKAYWRYDFDVDVHVLALVPVETIVDNKKIKAEKGEVEVQVKANLVWGWAKKVKMWPLRDIIYRWFLHDTRKRLENELYENVYGFRDALANFFRMPHFESKKGGIEAWARKLPEE